MSDYEKYQNRQDFINGFVVALIETYGRVTACHMTKQMTSMCESQWREKQSRGKRETQIRGLLAAQTGLKQKNIPRELVEVKELNLTIKHLLRGIENEYQNTNAITRKTVGSL